MKQKYAPIVDLVRCGAAILVMLYHFGSTWPHTSRAIFDEMGYPPPNSLSPYFHFGFVGVEIFFVISGYVIAGSAVGRAPSQFLKGRVIRLAPVLWISTIVGTAILMAFGGSPGELLQRALRSLFLVPFGSPLDPVIWTLQIEVGFYLVVWTLLCVLKRHIERALMWYAGALIVVSIIYLLALKVGLHFGNFLPQFLLFRHGGFFALGILIWRATTGAPLRAVPLLGAAASCALEIVDAVSERNATAGTDYSVLPTLAAFTAGAIMVWLGSQRTRNSASPAVRMAGLMTYPIYLLHCTIGGAVASVAINRGGLPHAPAIAMAAAAVLIGSWATVRFLEPALARPMKLAMEVHSRPKEKDAHGAS